MKRLFEALSKTDDGAFIIDRRNRIIFWNQAAQTILGYTAEEAADRHCYEILGGRDDQGRTLCQRFCRIVINTMQGESHPNIDVYAQTKHNSGRWINVTTFAFPTGDRSLGSVIVHLFRDVTQTKTHERLIDELVEASERLQDTNKQMRPAISPIEPALHPDHSELTPRERQILHLLAHGLSTGNMATTLSISPSTVRNHIQSILGKLDVHSRLEAVAYAYQHDLIAG